MSKTTRTTALRLRMIDAMVLRGFALRTQEAYVAAVRLMAQYHHSNPQRWLMEMNTSHRGTSMPYYATARAPRDGEVPFIR